MRPCSPSSSSPPWRRFHTTGKSSSESRALESRHEADGLEARIAQMERSNAEMERSNAAMTEQFGTFTEQILELKKRNRKLEKQLAVHKLETGNTVDNTAVSRAPPSRRASPASPTRSAMVCPGAGGPFHGARQQELLDGGPQMWRRR